MSGPPTQEPPPNQHFATPYTTTQFDSSENAAASTTNTEMPLTTAPLAIHPRIQQAGVTISLVVAAVALYKLERALERLLQTEQ
ncbi:MAG: hypothetical protein AB4050_13835 [Synechococcus sp.]